MRQKRAHVFPLSCRQGQESGLAVGDFPWSSQTTSWLGNLGSKPAPPPFCLGHGFPSSHYVLSPSIHFLGKWRLYFRSCLFGMNHIRNFKSFPTSPSPLFRERALVQEARCPPFSSSCPLLLCTLAPYQQHRLGRSGGPGTLHHPLLLSSAAAETSPPLTT